MSGLERKPQAALRLQSRARGLAARVAKSTIILLLLLTAGCGESVDPETGRPPNIVFILLDDLGYADLGAYGGTRIHTPRIDRLASRGVRLTQYYANSPVCSPTRAALLTGHFPSRFSIREIVDPMLGNGSLPRDFLTLPDVLRDRGGYATAHVGKWHLGRARQGFGPADHGSDYAVRQLKAKAGEPKAMDLTYHVIDGRSGDVGRDCAPKDPCGSPGHRTASFVDYSLRFIDSVCPEDQPCSQPFFLNLWLKAPHRPQYPPADLHIPETFRRDYPDYPAGLPGDYYRNVSNVDFEIGRLIDELRNRKLAEDTLIIVTSDNGSEAIDKHPESTGGLRGYKKDVFEGGIRQPLILYWLMAEGNHQPGVPAGTVRTDVISGLDLFPTLAGLAKVDVSDLDLPGRNLWPALSTGREAPEPPLLVWEQKSCLTSLCRFREQNRIAVRSGRWKLVRQSALIDGTPPLLRDTPCGGRGCLFDVEEDPREIVDLAAKHPEIMDTLWKAYGVWRLRVGSLPVAVESTRGDVTGGDPWEFGGSERSGGLVALARSDLHAIHEFDFSLRLKANPRTLGDERRVISELPGSWELSIDPDGYLHFRVQGPSRSAGDARRVVDLRSRHPLVSGQDVDIAATIFGYRGEAESTVALYIDGTVQQVAREGESVSMLYSGVCHGGEDEGLGCHSGADCASGGVCAGEGKPLSAQPRISIGGAADGSDPFLGVVSDFQLWNFALRPVDLRFGLWAANPDDVTTK